MEERERDRARARDWESLAPELLELVVLKVQGGEGIRGEGRRVVAVVGVCKAWRRSVLQLVKLQRRPAAYPLLTFPASTRHQVPSASHLLQCLLEKSGDTFRLVQVLVSGDEYFLLAARKKFTIRSSSFRISADPRLLWTDHSEYDDTAASILNSNFWRTTFTLQDHYQNSSAESGANPPTPILTTLSLKYEEVAIAGNCLRRMRCTKLRRIPGPYVQNHEGGLRVSRLVAVLKWTNPLSLLNWPSISYSPKFFEHRGENFHTDVDSALTTKGSSSDRNDLRMFSLRNKDPNWHEGEQRWSLDFQGRGAVVVPSVHNFQVVYGDGGGDGRVVLQVGKLCKGLFLLDFGAPLSALEALAIALSSFGTSVGIDAM